MIRPEKDMNCTHPLEPGLVRCLALLGTLAIGGPAAALAQGIGWNQTVVFTADAYAARAADWDGDGDLDIIAASYFDDSIYWSRNDAGVYGPRELLVGAADGLSGPQTLEVGDLNGDGFPDLVTGGTVGTDDEIRWYLNDGNAGIDAPFSASSSVTNDIWANSIRLGDVDGDGDLDIVAIPQNYAYVLLGSGSGDGTFSFFVLPGTGGPGATGVIAVRDFAVYDATGDGDLDLGIVGLGGTNSSTPTRVGFLENLGSWVFGNRVNFNAPGGARVIAAGDLNGNALGDVVVAAGDSLLEFVDTQGPGSVVFAGDATISALAIADLNLDGSGDVVFGNKSGAVQALMSDGAGGYILEVLTLAATGVRSVEVFTPAGSCRPQVLVASSGDDKVSILEDYSQPVNCPLDCDGDGVFDYLQIAADPALDTDLNGILDSCENLGPLWVRSPYTQRLYTALPPMTWSAARVPAVGLGGFLTTVRTAEENEWLSQTFIGQPFWIGLQDAVNEGAFQWHSQEPVTFTNWNGSPGNFTADQDWVALDPSTGLWDTWFNASNWRSIVESSTVDCDANMIADGDEIASDPGLDCDLDGNLDLCQIFDDPSLDCNGDGALDSCQVGGGPFDCDSNGQVDACEIALDPSLDCNADGVLDACQVGSGPFDCDANGLIDSCEIDANPSLDCDDNGVIDECELPDPALDCDGDGFLDSCEIALDPSLDCNADGILDACQVGSGPFDCDANGLVDTCEIDADPNLDCDDNGVIDVCELPDAALDCDGNGLIDSCELSSDPSLDCNGNGIFDPCEGLDPLLDCDGNGLIDTCEITSHPSLDCNGDSVLDACQIGGPLDCDANGLIDSCEIQADGTGTLDCNGNGQLDVCENLDPSTDINGDGLVDDCFPANYCTGGVNSTGGAGVMEILGSVVVADDDFTLHATGLPAGQWSYFLMSQSTTQLPGFGGSQGVLCLGAPIIRWNVTAGQNQSDMITQTTAQGTRSYPVDFGLVPQGYSLLPGATWYFQLWFRDNNPTQTSNTTDGIEVMFR